MALQPISIGIEICGMPTELWVGDKEVWINKIQFKPAIDCLGSFDER